MISIRIIRQKWVTVVTARNFGSAARNMAALGWPRARIRAALRMKQERLAAALAPRGPGLWGEYAGVISRELRRAA